MSRVEPGFERSDRAVNGSSERDADLAADAVLVGIGPPDGQNDSLALALDLLAINCKKFGAPGAAWKANEQQRPIPEVLEPVAHHPKNDKEVFPREQLGLPLGRGPTCRKAIAMRAAGLNSLHQAHGHIIPYTPL